MKFKGFWTREILRYPADGSGAPPPVTDAEAVQAQADTQTETQANEAAASEVDAGPDLSWIPEAYRGDDGTPDIEGFRTAFEEMTAEQARREEAAALIPDEYHLAYPQDMDFGEMDLPEGFALQMNAEDPVTQGFLGELGETLKSLNAPAETAPKLMGLLAKFQAQQVSAGYKAVREEHAKLGSNAAQRQARLGQVKRSLETRLPEAQANALLMATTSYEGVRALEALLAPSGPGASRGQTRSAEVTEEQALARRYSKTNQKG